ncbi:MULTISPECIES: GlcG/HbpS family heme-binding protein [Pantoea]|uniref:Heme-binding protein n=1 Tax=Candidatus Pantoea multigeneris TaxID=2608357 RepID=A0ABX0REF8_9GAMM|nr:MULTISPECIES: heme-binding protein [Pantoea]NIF23745.1 heme-binding protein [Pantoea multigeneris]
MKKLLSLAVLTAGLFGGVAAHATTTQTILTQSDAQKLIVAAKDKAHELKANVCIAVLDQAGQLLAFERMDNAPVGCIDSSILKGRAAALYRTPTDKYMDRANGKEPAIATLPGVIPLGGGSPVVYQQNTVIGSVGVSGSANPNEIAIAKAASDSFK